MTTGTEESKQTETTEAQQPASTQELAPAAPQQGLGPVPKAPVKLGLAPQTLEEGYRLAQLMAQTTLVPEHFQKKPAEILVAIELGLEVGLAPMQALQSIAVINGRPSIWGDGFLALIMASAHYADHDEYYEVDGERRAGLVAEDWKKDNTAAVCTFARRDKRTPVTARFTVGQAKKAGLLEKKGPWPQYPDRMLKMRARSWAGRDCFPDVLRGIRSTEEAFDTPETELDLPPAPPVRRISDTPKPATTPPVASSDVTLGPVAVKGIQPAPPLLGGYTVMLADGTAVHVANDTDAGELEKFVGAEHKVRLVCAKVEAGLQLKSFGIAD